MSLNRRLRRLEHLVADARDTDEPPEYRAAREQIEADIEAIIVQHNLTPADVERIAVEIREEMRI